MAMGVRNALLVLCGASMILLNAVPVMAGTGPGHLGLPVASAYGNLYQNNQLSAMCVDCHSGNPSLYSPESSGRTVNDPAYLGTHFYYRAGKLTNNTTLEKLDAWGTNADPNYTGGLSKYGNVGTGTSVTGVVGEMICESCHNIVINAPGSTTIPAGQGNWKLLAWDSEQTPTGFLCEGCHGVTSGLLDLANFNHRTGDINSVTGLALSTADDARTRSAPLTGSGVTYPASNQASCRSCHVAHDGITGAGAKVLKRGYSRAQSTSGGPVLGVSTTGLDRQYDIDSAVPPTNRLVTDYTPLCDSCHKFND